MKNKKVYNSVVISMTIVLGLFIFLAYKSYNNKNIVLEDVNLKETKETIKGSGSFAIMVENDSGSYVEYTDSNSWPTSMYYNSELSGCVDTNGNTLSDVLSYADGVVTVTTNATAYCYLYFDKDSTSGAATTLISTAESDTTDGLWISTLTNDGYRYVGTDPDNYICFGTDDTDECTSNTDLYMYRIIGIFADSSGDYHLKLIKKEALETAYAWHSSNTTDTNWGSSALYAGINGSYFYTNTTYSYMQDNTWTDLITNWTWTAVNTLSYSSTYGPYYYYNTGQIVYYHETNQQEQMTKTVCYYGASDSSILYCQNGEWTTTRGILGIMYASDYLLSLGSSALSLTSTSYTTLVTGWLHLSNNDTAALSTTGTAPASVHEWTMARWGYSNSYYRAFIVNSAGYVTNGPVTNTCSVRPVFYLTSDTTITGGTGTSSDPYIIG